MKTNMKNFDIDYISKKTVTFHIFGGGGNRNRIELVAFDETLQQCFRDSDFIESEDEEGNTLPDNEWRLLDGAGNTILEGRSDIESKTGRLEYDGEYDTYVVTTLDDLSEREKDAIREAYKNQAFLDEELKFYALYELSVLPLFGGVATFNADAACIECDTIECVCSQIAQCGYDAIYDEDEIEMARLCLELDADDERTIYTSGDMTFVFSE